MQKKLIAIAIAGLGTFAGAAHAEDSLTLYGIIDVGVGSYSHMLSGASAANPNGQTATGVESGGLAPNIWGMKGKEDLGNGTKVIFDIEGSMSPNNGAIGGNSNGNLFGREAYVGLDSDSWGTLKVGLQLDPYLLAVLFTDSSDFMEQGSTLNSYVFGQGITRLTAGVTGIFDPNAVSYQTPDIGGVFHATGLYGFGGVAGSSSTLRYFSGNAVYHTNVILIDAAYFNFNDATNNNAVKAWHVGGSYRLNDAFKFYVAYDDSKTPTGGENLGFGSLTGGGPGCVNCGLENTQWAVGFAGNITPAIAYSVGYSQETDKNNTSDKASSAGLTLTYSLSKHTKLYGIVNALKAGSNGVGGGIANGYANTNVPGGPFVATGSTSDAFTVGIFHTF
jgi:predicted porin